MVFHHPTVLNIRSEFLGKIVFMKAKIGKKPGST